MSAARSGSVAAEFEDQMTMPNETFPGKRSIQEELASFSNLPDGNQRKIEKIKELHKENGLLENLDTIKKSR